jgi:hypothetical protein
MLCNLSVYVHAVLTRLCTCLQEEVLALVCANLCDVRTMCAALCTSNSARQSILAKCSGALQLHIQSQSQGPDPSTAEKAASLQRVIRQAAWLAQHGRLVGQLQLQQAT